MNERTIRLTVLASFVLCAGCSAGPDPERPLPLDHPANPRAWEESYAPPRNPFDGELNPVTPESKPDPGATTYACPMHPEVTSSKPGTCPKCGMKLEPAKEKK